MLGAAKVASIAIETVAESEPAEFVPVTVYVVEVLVEVGVPDICPLRVLNAKPAGSDGEIVHDDAGEPLLIGVMTVIALFTTKL